MQTSNDLELYSIPVLENLTDFVFFIQLLTLFTRPYDINTAPLNTAGKAKTKLIICFLLTML